jgi:hypothetical protein
MTEIERKLPVSRHLRPNQIAQFECLVTAGSKAVSHLISGNQSESSCAWTCVQNSRIAKFGGAGGVRTRDLIDAIDARSQLRYGPTGKTCSV